MDAIVVAMHMFAPYKGKSVKFSIVAFTDAETVILMDDSVMAILEELKRRNISLNIMYVFFFFISSFLSKHTDLTFFISIKSVMDTMEPTTPTKSTNIHYFSKIANILGDSCIIGSYNEFEREMFYNFPTKEVVPTKVFIGKLRFGVGFSKSCLDTDEMEVDALENAAAEDKFRGIEISVRGFMKTSEVKIPGRKKVTVERGLDIRDPLNITEVGHLKVNKVPVLDDDEDIGQITASTATQAFDEFGNPKDIKNWLEVEDGELIKAYRYGKNFVPLADIESRIGTFATTENLEIIGFVRLKNLWRPHFNSVIISMVADTTAPTNDNFLFDQFYVAMVREQSAALVRYVKEAGQQPYIGALIPSALDSVYRGTSTDDSDVEEIINLALEQDETREFFFIKLPFADDVKRYEFTSLDIIFDRTDNKKSRFDKTLFDKQTIFDRTDKFIQSLMLTDSENGELFVPETIPNPAVQRVWQGVGFRAAYPDHTQYPLPSPDEEILKLTKTPESILKNAENAIQDFEACFEVKKVVKATKRKRKDVIAAADATVEGEGGEDESGLKRRLELDVVEGRYNREQELENVAIAKGRKFIYEVGTVPEGVSRENPINNFTHQIIRKDVDKIEVSIHQFFMIVIAELFTLFPIFPIAVASEDESTRSPILNPVMEYMRTLRSTCLSISEWGLYNQYLQNALKPALSKKLNVEQGHNKRVQCCIYGFWKRMEMEELGLLTVDEVLVVNSDVNVDRELRDGRLVIKSDADEFWGTL